jgi:hypothetical protein
MAAWLDKRIQFHKKSFRLVWIPVMAIWTLFSNAVTIRDNFMSPHWQQRLATLSLLPKWPWYVWVIGVLVILLIGFLEGSYRAAQGDSRMDFVTGLPSHPPRVAPHGYGPHPGQDGCGLIVTNPGYPAFNVHIPPVPLGPSQWKLIFPLRMAQLLERDHKCFFAAYLEHPTLPGRPGNDLFQVMRANSIDEFDVAIVYQDGEFRWYRSGCLIEREVEVVGGIRVSFVEQELIPEPPDRLQLKPEPTTCLEAKSGFSVDSEVIRFRPPENTDPMVYLSVINDDELFQQTRLILHNTGGGVAHKVRIQELKVGQDLVKFSSLAVLGTTEKQYLLPVIEDGPFPNKHNLLAVLNKEWSTNGGDFTQEYPFDLFVDYEDVKHHQFRTLVAMMYYPVRDSQARNNTSISPRPHAIILEVKNIELRRLS